MHISKKNTFPNSPDPPLFRPFVHPSIVVGINLISMHGTGLALLLLGSLVARFFSNVVIHISPFMPTSFP